MSEKRYQVKVIDDAGLQQGEAMILTDKQVDELCLELPDGWGAETVEVKP
jgi:hypothetical protein